MVERWLITGFLTTAALTDLARRRIYRLWSASALASGLLLVLLEGRWSHLLLALVLFTAAYALWQGGGIGGGDVWLATYLGLSLGINAPLALLLGSLAGLAVALLLIGTGKHGWRDPLPVGLFWALGGLVVLATGWTLWPT